MTRKLCTGLTLTALMLLAAPAQSEPTAAAQLPGQKLDSGLGSLPHYSRWADPTGRTMVRSSVIGESLDDGLGDLPHYSKWLDRSGRDPMGRLSVTVASTQR